MDEDRDLSDYEQGELNQFFAVIQDLKEPLMEE